MEDRGGRFARGKNEERFCLGEKEEQRGRKDSSSGHLSVSVLQTAQVESRHHVRGGEAVQCEDLVDLMSGEW